MAKFNHFKSARRFRRFLKESAQRHLPTLSANAAFFWLASANHPILQQGNGFQNLSTQIDSVFTSLLQIAHNIAPAVGILGFIGLGIIYMGSSWPIVGTWKQQNPNAAGQVMLGLFFVMFGGLVVSILPNPGGFS